MAGRSRAHRGKQEGGSLWHEALLVGSRGSIDRRCRAGGVRRGQPWTDTSCPALPLAAPRAKAIGTRCPHTDTPDHSSLNLAASSPL